MRSSSALVLHLLRQHAVRMSATPSSLQASPLLSVLPHLLRPELSSLTSLHSLRFALPYSVQAVESQVRVTHILITSLAVSFLMKTFRFVLTILLCVQRTNLFNAHPKSLQFDRGTDEPKPEVATSRLRQALLTISGFYSKESQLLRGGHLFYNNTIVATCHLQSLASTAMACRKQKSLPGSCATGCKQTAIQR